MAFLTHCHTLAVNLAATPRPSPSPVRDAEHAYAGYVMWGIGGFVVLIVLLLVISGALRDRRGSPYTRLSQARPNDDDDIRYN